MIMNPFAPCVAKLERDLAVTLAAIVTAQVLAIFGLWLRLAV